MMSVPEARLLHPEWIASLERGDMLFWQRQPAKHGLARPYAAPQGDPGMPTDRLQILEAIASKASRLSETIHLGEIHTKRTFAGDLGSLDRSLQELRAIDDDVAFRPTIAEPPSQARVVWEKPADDT